MSYNPQNPNGSATSANSSPVVIASDQANFSTPLNVSLPAAQVTTLTPPAAITNYANETGGNLATIANTVGTVAPGTAGTKSQLGGGVYNSTPPSLTNGQQTALQLDSDGSLQVSVRDIVALPANQSINVSQINAHTAVEAGVNGTLAVGGNVATNTAIGTNPINLGAQGVIAENTAVTATWLAQIVADKVGKLITLPYANPENFVKGSASATTTGTTSLISAVTSQKIYITSISVSNTGVASANITIQDGSGGTALYYVAAPAGGGAIISLPVPISNTAGNAIYFASSAASTTIYVSAAGYSGV